MRTRQALDSAVMAAVEKHIGNRPGSNTYAQIAAAQIWVYMRDSEKHEGLSRERARKLSELVDAADRLSAGLVPIEDTPATRSDPSIAAAVCLQGSLVRHGGKNEQWLSDLSRALAEVASHAREHLSNAIEPATRGRPTQKARDSMLGLLLVNYADQFGEWPSQYAEGRDFELFKELASLAGIQLSRFDAVYSRVLADRKRNSRSLNDLHPGILPSADHKRKKIT